MKSRYLSGKSKLLLLLLLSVFGGLSVNAQLRFEKHYGGGGFEEGGDVRQTFDGGYIMVGQTQSYGAGSDDVYLIKTDANGDTLWTKTYGAASYDKGYSIEQTTDSGYIVTGMTNNFVLSGEGVYLIKTDKNGVLLWSKVYGGNLGGAGHSVKQTTDGGYIIGGIKVDVNGIHDVVLIKTDATGDTLWTRTYGGTGDDYGLSVVQTIDGGYLLAGSGSTTGVCLFKTNSIGDSIWTKTFYTGLPHLNYPYCIQQTADNGFIVAGIAYVAGVDMYVLKIDSIGTTQWAKTYSGTSNDYAMSIQQTSDGGYIMGGWSQSFPTSGSYHSTVLRLDAVGDTLWTKIFDGGGGASFGYSVRQTTDGGFIFLSTAYQDFYLVKMDANGNSGCNLGNASAVATLVTHTLTPFTTISRGGTVIAPATIVNSGGIVITLCSNVGINELLTGNTEIVIYPNPFTNELKISGTGSSEIVLYDVTGKEILRQNIAEGETTLNTENISAGFYLLNYSGKNKFENIKLLKF